MALTELYIDPSIAADSGAGTVGDPYGDLEYCLSATAGEAFDTTNGTRINIKSGTAEVLSAPLDLSDFTTGGGPSQTAHLIFQGYTAAADDGDWDAQTGIGAIGCDGNTMFASQTYDFMHFRHLEIFGKAGAGYTYLIDIDDYCTFVECELHTHSGTDALLRLNLAGMVIRCHFHTVTSAEMCLYIQSAGLTVMHSYFDLVGSSATVAIYAAGYGQAIIGNIIRVDGSGSGIQMPCRSSVCANNSIHSAGGTGDGIKGYTSYSSPAYIGNNIIEGFSGSGGNGFDASTVTGLYTVFANNYVTNCETNYSAVPVYHDDGGNEDIADTTAFTDADNENFTPVDTGNVKEGSWPQSAPSADGALTAPWKTWKGAAEPAVVEPAVAPAGAIVNQGLHAIESGITA
jgi:hypothetical protein